MKNCREKHFFNVLHKCVKYRQKYADYIILFYHIDESEIADYYKVASSIF